MKLAPTPISTLERIRSTPFGENAKARVERKKASIESDVIFLGSKISENTPTGICIVAYDHPNAEITSPRIAGDRLYSLPIVGSREDSVVFAD